jgi:hypothetical protein
LYLQGQHICKDVVAAKMAHLQGRHVDLNLIETMMGLVAAKPWKHATFHFLNRMNIITSTHFNSRMGKMEANKTSQREWRRLLLPCQSNVCVRLSFSQLLLCAQLVISLMATENNK